MHRLKLTAAIAAATAIAATFAVKGLAYSTFGKWSNSSAVFYINPQNGDVDPAAAEAAVRAGMDAWQAASGIDLRLGGRVNDTTTGNDSKNVILFRNTGNPNFPGALASTYWWTMGGTIVDADIIFWDGDFTFFTGSSGCDGGVYIEDVATHELGHAIGLQHSTVADATMVSGTYFCSLEKRTLAADDIAGVQSLYPSRSSSNSAPTVSITSPSNGSVSDQGAILAFSGSANDYEQGNLGSSLRWTSTIDGSIGTGASFTKTLSPGTHTIRAEVQDSGGLLGYSQVTVTVNGSATTTTSSTGPSLRVRGYKVKGVQKADLTWSGLTAASVDVLRNGGFVTTTPNDSAQTDTIKKGGGTYNYQVCAAGTTVCSNTASVTF